MKNKLVSVIVTSYNYGQYLDECLESIHKQTYKYIEIIIVDDGSNDLYTKAKLKELCLKGEKVIQIANSGVSVARNIGVKEAQGKYIIFLDADDKLAPEYIKNLMDIQSKYPDVMLTYSFTQYFGATARLRILKNKPRYGDLLINNYYFGITCLLHKKRIEEIGGFNDKMRMGIEDWEFFIRYCYEGMKVGRVNDALFFYRIKSNSRSKKLLESRKNNLIMRIEILNNNIDQYLEYFDSLMKFKLGENIGRTIDYIIYKLSSALALYYAYYFKRRKTEIFIM